MSSPWGRSSTAATRHACLLDQGGAPLGARGSQLPFLWGQGHSRGLGASLETTRAREGESPGAGSVRLLRPSHTQEGDLSSLAPVQPSTKSHPFPSIVVCFFPFNCQEQASLLRRLPEGSPFQLQVQTLWPCSKVSYHPGLPGSAEPSPPCPSPHPSVLAGVCTAPILPSPVVSELQVVLGSYKGVGVTEAAQALQAMPPTHSVPTMASLPHRPTNGLGITISSTLHSRFLRAKPIIR